jgi:hypothetical protein
MDVIGVTPHPFRVTASVPDEVVTLDADGDWAAWSGVAAWTGPDGGRQSVVLVSIAVAAFRLAPAATAGEALKAALRDHYPAGAEEIDEFRTGDGNPALRMRCTVTQRVKRRPVTTGQAQALVVFPRAGALGVVSAVCPDPADLDRAAVLVSDIAGQLTVTATSAAA